MRARVFRFARFNLRGNGDCTKRNSTWDLFVTVDSKILSLPSCNCPATGAVNWREPIHSGTRTKRSTLTLTAVVAEGGLVRPFLAALIVAPPVLNAAADGKGTGAVE